jgi:hypothetical protein
MRWDVNHEAAFFSSNAVFVYLDKIKLEPEWSGNPEA